MSPGLTSAKPRASVRAVGCCAAPRAQSQPLNAIVRGTVTVGAALALAAAPAFADLNKFEAATGGIVPFSRMCQTCQVVSESIPPSNVQVSLAWARRGNTERQT